MTSRSATVAIRPCITSRRASGSRLPSGSSSSSSSGSLASASVIATWACCPPDSLPALRSSGISSVSSRLWAKPWSKRGLSSRPKRSSSATVNSRYSGLSWATKATRPSAAGLPACSPTTRSVPAVGERMPTASCMSVVLPAPLDPTSATTRPRGSRSEQSRSAQVRP